MQSCGNTLQPPRPAAQGRGTPRTSVPRSGTLAQTEFISAEHFDHSGFPQTGQPVCGMADADVKSILTALELECGAVLR